MKQMIISVGREFGSGGHEIAMKLAEHYGLPLYDHNLLDEIATKRGLDIEDLRDYDEKKRNKLLYRSVNGMNSSPSHNVAQLQFDYLKEKAASGESFVVVGRCSETILKGYKGLISIFILADLEAKVPRIMHIYNKNAEEAEALAHEKDRRRKKYHNSHCPIKWGDSRNYDVSINSTKLGINGTADMLIRYIDERRAGKKK